MPEPQTPAQRAYEAWVRSKESPEVPPTPGQVAYEAYAAVLHDTVLLEPWRRLLWLDRTAWDAAAQAVLEACVASARPLDMVQDDTP